MKLHFSTLATTATLLLLAAAAVAAQAESLPDPTRPPETVEAASGGGQPVPAGLQSIIRSNRGKPAAIINGEYVVLGGQVGDAQLVRIGEDSVTLRSPAGTETLKLMPGIEKTPASSVEEKGAPATVPSRKGRR